MSPLLLQELKTRLHKLQSTGFIRPSTSAWSSPILFAKNASGSLWFCVDYRALNSVTKKDRHPLPLIQECFDALQGAKFFSKIDLQQGFHQMKISSADVPKTAFGTKYGHYEWLVMPFGLVNVPSTFQRMMTHILREYIDVFVQVYLDDILIYSDTEDDHAHHIDLVLSLLQTEELRCSGHKCSFGLEEIQYVGHLVSQNGIRPMPEKLKAVESWPCPSNVHDVRSFLGLCGFYRRYVKNFAKIASPLHDLTGGNVTKRQIIKWFPLHEKAFLELKAALVTAPVLLMPDSSKPYTIETDASDYAIGAVLLQLGLDDLPHPVAFESSKLNSAQRNYPAQERELLAIIHSWRKWHVYLDGAVCTTIVYTDHASLQYLHCQKLPSKRLSRWIDEFSEMDILVKYKKGCENIVPDALSRRSDLLVIQPVSSDLHCSDWPLLIPSIIDKIDIPSAISSSLITTAMENRELFSYDAEAEVLLYKGRPGRPESSPFIPFVHRLDLLHSVHDSLGHCGRDATLSLLRGRGWWPHRATDVKDYIRTCSVCQTFERPRHSQQTSEQVPLPAVGPFERWSADFISMPESSPSGFKWILTVIDHCTSWPIAVPMKEATASAIADVLLQHVIIPFGTPREFLTDRGSNFLSKGLLKFLANSNIEKINTSGYHPQTNGKNERFNGILEAAIFRLNKTGDPSKWESVLAVALYSTRIHASDSSGFSPFELTYGVSPPLAVDRTRMIAEDPVCPGEDELRAHIRQINEKRCKALSGLSERSSRNKQSFDNKLGPDVITYDVGQSVKLRNEKYTKGQPRWYGPFEISKKLDNNVYILNSPDGEEYGRPVNGNNLRHVSLRSLITNDMWATPPIIAQQLRQKDARVAREALAKTKAIAKLTVPP
jgi:transposase InsO family protein